ncbi:MAG: YhcH/YjgK/YiaL family protein [Nitrospirae bacterium]|nr:YhcH/YjgK/YiaL family protein [Nitrospirota bacterium]
MIVTDLNHIDRQLSMTESLNKAIAFLRGLDTDRLTEGKVEIDGHRVFALFQRYETVAANAPKFEYHKKYIDVQYVVAGEEVIGWVPAGCIKITEEYEADKDICFGEAPKHQITPIYLGTGQLAVLYPEDGHAPRLAARGPSTVCKIVIKVAL